MISTSQSVDKIWPGLTRQPSNGEDGSQTDALTDRIAEYDIIIQEHAEP